MAICKLRRAVSGDRLSGGLTLDPEYLLGNQEERILLIKPPSLWCVSVAALANSFRISAGEGLPENRRDSRRSAVKEAEDKELESEFGIGGARRLRVIGSFHTDFKPSLSALPCAHLLFQDPARLS